MDDPHRIGLHIALQGSVEIGLTGLQHNLAQADRAAMALGFAARGIAPRQASLKRKPPPRHATPEPAAADVPVAPQHQMDRPPDARPPDTRPTLARSPLTPLAVRAKQSPPRQGPVSPSPHDAEAPTMMLAALADAAEQHTAPVANPSVAARPSARPASPHIATPHVAAWSMDRGSVAAATLLLHPNHMPPRTATAPTLGAKVGAPRSAIDPEPSPPARPSTPLGSGQPVSDTVPPSQEGRLIIDGTALGRWIIDHLTREIDRPSAAGTAVDPRMGRNWPGPLQGR